MIDTEKINSTLVDLFFIRDGYENLLKYDPDKYTIIGKDINCNIEGHTKADVYKQYISSLNFAIQELTSLTLDGNYRDKNVLPKEKNIIDNNTNISDVVEVFVIDNKSKRMFALQDYIINGKWATYKESRYTLFGWRELPYAYTKYTIQRLLRGEITYE